MAEREPLKPSVSLRFPAGAVGPEGGTQGAFDGNNPKTEPLSYITRVRDYEPPIPQPYQSELDAAKEKTAREGVDPRTNLPWQPEWMSVLQKRRAPYACVRWLLCNCCCTPTWTMTRAQW
jgi:hypothetical protein